MKRLFSNFTLRCAALLIIFFAVSSVSAQRRDYMNEAESDIIREAQEIDRRIEALTKMIERRFAVLSNQPPPVKDEDLWGAPPTGTRLQLLSDVNKLLQKAVDDIDDVAAHNRVESKLFPKAMNNLDKSCGVFTVNLKNQYDKAADDREKGLIAGSLDLCGQISEAAAKVPTVVPKEEKKDKKKKSSS